MQNDMVNLRKFKKDDEGIYSDFYNSAKTFKQIPIDRTVRVGFSERQVDSFNEWDIVCSVINSDGLSVLMKLQNERYFPIVVKLFYKEPDSLPYSVEQML